jgi:hypothetical protein
MQPHHTSIDESSTCLGVINLLIFLDLSKDSFVQSEADFEEVKKTGAK